MAYKEQCECYYNRYISASDTNTTFKATFEFIKNNQVNKNGYLVKTAIITSLTLLENQGTKVDTPRDVVETFITGIITEVQDSYVVLLDEFKCDNGVIKYGEYKVKYNTIKNLFNNVLGEYLDNYLKIMKLPLIEKNCCNRDYVLLNELKETIKANKDDSCVKLSIIYDGISSLDYSPDDFIIVKNLILIKKVSGIIPITQVGGFFWRDLEC